MSRRIILEACIETVEAAIAAEAAGADRIELCSNLAQGGLSPSPAAIRACKAAIKIPVHVLIRPRSGDFLYSDSEFDLLCAELQDALQAGADGLVWGCLTAEGDVDLLRCRKLMQLSQGKPATFHRAFDMSRDLSAALNTLLSLGVGRVLSSGGALNAAEGANILQALTKQAAGRLSILGGGGINAANVAALIRGTGLTQVHASAMAQIPSRMQYQNPGLSLGKGPAQEYLNPAGNSEKIRALREALDAIEF